ncbi:hypothetical protein VMCG_04194 [Cytospora schulzeri]|uniref:DUF4440 domain-containing protein n=1 Tax=Cytospora schulzeri TaxID=448051 RepID=A0A423WTM3_9PEZI|nr:hypothetical protein VMCG_04194 [Valsa malicola]
MPAGNSNSIYERNCKAARDCETLLWRALCDEPDSAMEYIEPDCVIINPLIHPEKSQEALTAKSSPSLSEALEKLADSGHQWTSYKMHKHDPEPAIAEVEMMAVQIMYRITLIRERRKHHHHQHGEGEREGEEEGRPSLQTVDAFCTSTWRQGASGDWKLCAQSLVPV